MSMLPNSSSPSSWPLLTWSWKKRLGAISCLLVIDLFLSFFHIQDIPLFDPDEPRYAAAGRTMAEGGSWIIPKFNGKPRINKPPLIYWLVAISDLAMGEANETSARLPSIFMGLIMLGLTVWMGARLYGDPFGFLAGLILCTSPLFLSISRTCIIDQTFSTLLSLALSCMLLGLVNRWPWPKFHPVLATGIFAGLAFMAKGTPMLIVLLTPFIFVLMFYRTELLSGPGKGWIKIWLLLGVTGIIGSLIWDTISPPPPLDKRILPFPPWALGALVMAIFTTIYYGLRNFWRASPWIISCVLMLLIGSWWYVVIIASEHFIVSEQLHTELAKRLSGKMHKEPIVYYLYVFPALLLPWSVGIFGAMGSAFQKVTHALPLKEKGSEQPSENDPEQKSPRASHNATIIQVSDSFLFAWVATVIIFFSIPGAKLGTYVLPAFPAAALLLSRFILRCSGMGRPISKHWQFGILVFSIFLAEVFFFAAIGPKEQLRGPKFAPTDIRMWRGLILTILICFTALAAFFSATFFDRLNTSPSKRSSPMEKLGIGIIVLLPLLVLILGRTAFPILLGEISHRWQYAINLSPINFLVILIIIISAIVGVSTRLLVRLNKHPKDQPLPLLFQAAGFAAPLWAALIFGVAIIPTRIIEFPNRWQGIINDSPVPLWFACLIFALCFCLPWIAIALSGKHYGKLIITQTAFILLTIILAVPPSLGLMARKSNRTICREIEATIAGAERVFSVGCEEESLSYYLHRTVVEMRRPNKKKGEKHQDVVRETIELAAPGKVVLFVHHKYFKRWLKRKAPPGSRIISQNQHIVVMINDENEGEPKKNGQ